MTDDVTVGTCLTGYTKFSNACVKNIDNCATMATASTCGTCEANFLKNDASTACIGVANCDVMSPAECTTCNTHYFKKADNTECTTVPNCDVMSDATTCSSCLTGYTKIGTACI